MIACPDWPSLVEHRWCAEVREPEGWPSAIAHLRSCEACRRRALAADPTLLFQSFGETASLAEENEEVEEIRRGVRQMTKLESFKPPRQVAARRLSVAAGLLLATIGLFFAVGRLAAPAAPELAGRPVETAGTVPATAPVSELVRLPLVESLESPPARLYQWDRADLDLVVIVDASLEF